MVEATRNPPGLPVGKGPSTMEEFVARVLDPAAPLPLKRSAARGLLPLPRGILLRILVALRQQDAESPISELASRSLEEFARDGRRLSETLRDPATDPSVLAHFGQCMAGDGEVGLLRVIVAHPRTPDGTLEKLASSEKGEVLEAIFLNEARLSRAPGIVEALKSNPHLSSRQRQRIQEIEKHLLGKGTAGPAREPERVARQPGPSETRPVAEAALEEPETLPQDLDAEPLEEEIPASAFDRIKNLTIPERIQLALTADREERMILVRDTNKQVATAVLKSPKVNEKDVEVYAGLRNVDEEVLRLIGRKREWIKKYSVAYTLVNNPRTPTGLAMVLLGRIYTRDLKMLSGNRNIPEVVRRAARKIWQGRTQTKKVSPRGKK